VEEETEILNLVLQEGQVMGKEAEEAREKTAKVKLNNLEKNSRNDRGMN